MTRNSSSTTGTKPSRHLSLPSKHGHRLPFQPAFVLPNVCTVTPICEHFHWGHPMEMEWIWVDSVEVGSVLPRDGANGQRHVDFSPNVCHRRVQRVRTKDAGPRNRDVLQNRIVDRGLESFVEMTEHRCSVIHGVHVWACLRATARANAFFVLRVKVLDVERAPTCATVNP